MARRNSKSQLPRKSAHRSKSTSSPQSPTEPAVDCPPLHSPQPTRFLRQHAWWLVPVTLGALVRILYHVQLPDEVALPEFALLDSAVYADWAERIADGDIWGGPAPYTSAPAFAYFLGLLRWLGLSSTRIVFAVQGMLGLGSIYAIAQAAARLSSRRAAAVSASLYALYAPPATLETKLLGESLAILLSLLGVSLLARNRGWRDRTSAGASMGACALARPELVLTLPLLAGWTWLQSGGSWRPRTRAVLSFVLPATLVIGTVTMRNYMKSGEAVLISSQGGVTFYQGNNPHAEGTYSTPVDFSGAKKTQALEARTAAEHALGRSLSTKDVSSYWYGRGLEFLFDDPGRAMGLLFRKLRYWTNSAELAGDFGVTAERCLVPALHLIPVPFGLFLAACLLGIRRLAAPEMRAQSTLHGVIILSGLLTALIFFVSTRYRIVATAHLAVCASVYLHRVLTSLGRGGSPLHAALLTALTALTLPRWSDAPKMQAAEQLRDWATVHYAARRMPEALGLLEAAKRARPDSWTIRYSTGLVYGALGDFRKAASEMRRALRLRPRSAATRKRLAEYEGRMENSRSVKVAPRCEL